MKTLFYNAILLLFLLTTSYGTAQDQKLYSFSLKQTDQFLTYSQGALVMSDTQTGTNKMAQCFIVKRLDNGKTLIASAAKPELFLKRNGTAIVLSAYAGGDATLEWDIRYSGYPYGSIMEPGTNNVLSWQNGSGLSMQAISAALTGNNDTTGDTYRFGISTVTNTF